MTDKQGHRLELWKLVVGSSVAIIVVLVPLIWNAFNSDEEPPQFALSSPIISAGTTLAVFARNDMAKRKSNIHVEWDGFLFHDGGKASKRAGIKYSWQFIPEQLLKDKSLIDYGQHKIRFSFNNSKFSDYLQVLISENVVVSIPKGISRISRMPNKPGKKRALIIGNSHYRSIPSLSNTVNDAKLIANQLKKVGFEVTVGINLSESEFRTNLAKFFREQGNNDTILIYYAGHGLQLEGTNYILPVDAEYHDESDVRMHGIPVDQLTHSTKDLQNQIVLFAVAPGNLALDGGEGSVNSPFAASLARYLIDPDEELSSAFRKVIQEVRDRTDGRQIPWLYSSVSDRIILNPVSNSVGGEGQSVSIVILDASHSVSARMR